MAEKEVIIEFSKMVLEHNDSLLKISGGLVVFNMLLMANLKTPNDGKSSEKRAYWLIAASALAATCSFIVGFLANSVVIAQMSDYATDNEWKPSAHGEYFSLIQALCLAVGLAALLLTILFYTESAMDALRKSKLGGGE